MPSRRSWSFSKWSPCEFFYSSDLPNVQSSRIHRGQRVRTSKNCRVPAAPAPAKTAGPRWVACSGLFALVWVRSRLRTGQAHRREPVENPTLRCPIATGLATTPKTGRTGSLSRENDPSPSRFEAPLAGAPNASRPGATQPDGFVSSENDGETQPRENLRPHDRSASTRCRTANNHPRLTSPENPDRERPKLTHPSWAASPDFEKL